MTERKTNWWNFRSLIFFVLTCGLVVSAVSAAVPVADFTVLPAIGDTPLTSAFTDTSINVPDTWNWSFGDGSAWVNGTTAAEQNPSHTYTFPGAYTITLICNSTAGSDTKTGVSVSASSVAIPGGITSVLAAFAIAGVGLIVAGVVIVIRSLQGVMGYQSRYGSSTGGELVAGIIAIMLGATLLIVGYFILSPLFDILGLGI